ncbi:MAG: amidohydrolase [Calditrichia bacterium]
MDKFIGPNTEVVSIKGQYVLPGLIEGHGHFKSLGMNLSRIQLQSTKSYREAVHLIAQKAQSIPKGEWIIGRGWHQNKWSIEPGYKVHGYPSHRLLSSMIPDHPVYLIHTSGHGILVNKKAMDLAGISSSTISPSGGEILKDVYGNPTGIFLENAEQLILPFLPEDTPERLEQYILSAQDECLRNGITSFNDAGADSLLIEVYKSLYEKGKLKVRLYVMLNGDDPQLLQHYFKFGPVVGAYNDHLFVRSIKFYIDGALGSRGAWLMRPYSDQSTTVGAPVFLPDSILFWGREAIKHGFQLCTHAIGTRGNHEILNVLDSLNKIIPASISLRHRIEHAQHILLKDIDLFKQNNIIASMQPIHFASDITWAIDRLGKDRIRFGSYAWKSFIDNGVCLMAGTDIPVEPINPFVNMFTMISRRDRNGEYRSWYNREEAVSPAQAINSYTMNNAYGMFMENRLGKIDIGYYADLTIIDRNILDTDPDIANTSVIMTIIDGKIVYKKEK